jgi:hypothetical protein
MRLAHPETAGSRSVVKDDSLPVKCMTIFGHSRARLRMRCCWVSSVVDLLLKTPEDDEPVCSLHSHRVHEEQDQDISSSKKCNIRGESSLSWTTQARVDNLDPQTKLAWKARSESEGCVALHRICTVTGWPSGPEISICRTCCIC